ncbi:MAG: response regulator [Pirellulales bacterium]
MPRKSRILIGAGSPADAELIESCLEEVDCTTAVAINGHDLLEKAQSLHPDLVLLESMLRGLDGLEICKRLKAAPATRGVTILMVIELNAVRDIERAVRAGTDDFLSKPVDRSQLVQRVRNLLKNP